MNFGIKELVKAVVLLAVALYAAFLVYETISVSGYLQDSEDPVRPEWARDYSDIDANSLSAPATTRASDTPPSWPPIALEDLFISVKTTRRNHKTRLPPILQTWFQLAPNQTWFFTDIDDPDLQNKTNGHMINTKCNTSHDRSALCCKLSAEFDMYLESGKTWFCHVDDDNYLNVPRLLSFLNNYNPQEDWYLGKNTKRIVLKLFKSKKPQAIDLSFWFATGGAGFCVSHALALRMAPIAGMGRFISFGDLIQFGDDVTMGYIIEHLLRVPLTIINKFHSHYEALETFHNETFHDQITFSYVRFNNHKVKAVKINGFDERIDPTRFLSIHCFLFPNFNFCQR